MQLELIYLDNYRKEFKNMKVIFIETEKFEKYPPSISVVNALTEIEGVELHIVALQPSQYLQDLCQRYGICLHGLGVQIGGQSGDRLGLLRKTVKFIQNRKLLWKEITSLYDENAGDIIWVHSIITIKQLGKKLLGTRYIFHVYELLRECRMNYRLPFPKVDLKTYYNKAYKVVECEYNRSQILKAWFNLKQTPAVIPNKLYIRDDKDSDDIVLSNPIIKPEVRSLLEKIKGKKIILFQGGIGGERPIDKFIQAVGELGSYYAMLLMTGDKYEYAIRPDNLYICPFIPAPYHLAVTKTAYIGILCYKAAPQGWGIYDSLNSIYCAPNKLYEYSKYGLPMLGNDIPGLVYTVEASKMGICVDKTNVEDIKNGILEIEKHYDEMKKNSFNFYESTNIREIIEKEILQGQ